MNNPNLNARTRALLLLRLFLGLTLTNSLHDIIGSLRGVLKSRRNLVRPLHFGRIKFRPSKFLIKIALVTHFIFLGLGFQFGRIYDFTPILWYVSAKVQGIDTTDCMNMPIEVWSRIPACIEE